MDVETLLRKRKSVQILYVESEPDIRSRTSAMLRRLYGEVVTASWGQELILYLQHHQPHIILTEAFLRDMEFSRLLQELETLQLSIPLVFITRNPVAVARSGYKGYIYPKPGSERELGKIVDTVLYRAGVYDLL